MTAVSTSEDAAAQQATPEQPGGAGRRTARTRADGRPVGLIPRIFAAGRRNLHDWLDRPMTSLHLVLAIFLLLLALGLMMVLSSSSVTSYRKDGSSFAVFQSQMLFAALGLPVFVIASRLPLRVIRGASTGALLVSLALLVAVLVPGIGRRINGSRSWIGITSSIGFQPSELAKLALLLWAAHVLASRRSNLGSLRALLIPLMPVSALTALLIMLQPDFGTTVTLAIVLMAVLYFAGAPLWIFAVVGAAGAAAMVYLVTSAGYRMARLLALVDPEKYPDVSYQLRQALYGMGNGGWFGVGLGQSRAKWSWLPNADSDFIFAIIGEELGLIGALLVLVLFGLLAYTGMRIARRNVDPFVKIVAGSATVWLVCQAAINIGYVVGLLPTTGLTLPMISAGGTSLVVTMAVFGLLANFARREHQAAAALAARGPGMVLRFLGIGVVRADREIEPAKKAAKREAKRAKHAVKEAERAATRKVKADADAAKRVAARRVAAERAAAKRPPARRVPADRSSGTRGTGRPAGSSGSRASGATRSAAPRATEGRSQAATRRSTPSGRATPSGRQAAARAQTSTGRPASSGQQTSAGRTAPSGRASSPAASRRSGRSADPRPADPRPADRRRAASPDPRRRAPSSEPRPDQPRGAQPRGTQPRTADPRPSDPRRRGSGSGR